MLVGALNLTVIGALEGGYIFGLGSGAPLVTGAVLLIPGASPARLAMAALPDD